MGMRDCRDRAGECDFVIPSGGRDAAAVEESPSLSRAQVPLPGGGRKPNADYGSIGVSVFAGFVGRGPLARDDGDSSTTPLRRSARDRKSTRLNSSHSQISYAVFCLKKKMNERGDGSL